MSKMNPVVHFEMGYKDRDRMIKFYETVFGWKRQKMGQEMGNYVTAQTTETDKDFVLLYIPSPRWKMRACSAFGKSVWR
jgi:hypothetical protein